MFLNYNLTLQDSKMVIVEVQNVAQTSRQAFVGVQRVA